MKGTPFPLIVILLGLSHLLCIEAVPITRSESLMQGLQVHHGQENNVHNQEVMIERIDLELHDYPPSGANGRHTPRGPYP
ncbi:uncharacterized protein LOC130731892 [Lotus japonicus]|uniref:uncharacterized protein LOC130731892 n=1 Tax=Lotus japonicus TaxID=34305 RepID=UPI00258F5D6C|nr:uncharacterized protein LOC130731892 [Lotus japonicus]